MAGPKAEEDETRATVSRDQAAAPLLTPVDTLFSNRLRGEQRTRTAPPPYARLRSPRSGYPENPSTMMSAARVAPSS